jgi:sulfatase maturation enzyme AslB (radical SAM superfamily)
MHIQLTARRTILFLSIVMSMCLLMGCGKPSATDAQKIVNNLIQKQSHGFIKLINIKKTNAQEGEMMGVKLYSLEYEAVIQFIDNCYWAENTFTAQKNNPGPWGGFMTKWFRASRGQQTVVHGKLNFEKMEKGWRGEDGQIY